MLLSLLVVIVCSLIGAYCYWHSNLFQRKGLLGPHGWPVFGNMLHYMLGRQHYGEVYEHIYNKYPELSYVGIYRVFNEPAILLRSQELIKEIMIRSFNNFADNVLWVDRKRDSIIWCNPFIAKGQQWKEMRTELVPIFTPNKVRNSFPHINNVCQQLDAFVTTNLHTNNFELKQLFSKYTLAVVASAGYGLDAQTFSNNKAEFTQLVEHLFLPNPLSLLETTALLFSPTLGNIIRYCYVPTQVQKWLNNLIGSVLEKRLNTANINTRQHADFIQWLIEQKHRLNEPVNTHNIVGHCSTFLVEGFETSSSLMAFAMHMLAINKHVQERLLEEIDEVLAKHNGKIDYEALQEMSYLDAILYETLRLFPPMMALLKHCTQTFELPPQTPLGQSYLVPKGMVFVVPVRAVHRDANIYADPLTFKPERFATQADRQKFGCAFLGFGEGPRMCPGMRFGLLMSKAGLVTLLAKYSVELSNNATEELKIAPTTFLTATTNGIWIKFLIRK